MADLATTPLDALHRELGARMVPFAGYSMPVQYSPGIIKEHLHTRAHAGLFDVSHMGQVLVSGPDVTRVLESLLPTDLEALAVNRSVYSLLMNEEGGVRDDLIVTRLDESRFSMVLNADCKHADLEYLRAAAPSLQFELRDDLALLALQGPAARGALARLVPGVERLVFMSGGVFEYADEPIYVTCSGYTGEDGFEISVCAKLAERFARDLLAMSEVEPIGLGARDSLRLEAGLCLYGHELSDSITPVEAGLRWAVSKARRPDGPRAGGYPGAAVVAAQMATGAARKLVGLRVQGKRPVREGQTVLNTDGVSVGLVSSGAFGPSVDAPIAMAFIEVDAAAPGDSLAVDVRGKPVSVEVAKLPLAPHHYFRG